MMAGILINGARFLAAKAREKRQAQGCDVEFPVALETVPEKDVKRDRPRIRPLGRVPGTEIDVYEVDGTEVRAKHYIDFVMGGHDKVYTWIPNNEIWIEKIFVNDEREYPEILHHETVERCLMANGMDYEKAHGLATVAEGKRRRSCPVDKPCGK